MRGRALAWRASSRSLHRTSMLLAKTGEGVGGMCSKVKWWGHRGSEDINDGMEKEAIHPLVDRLARKKLVQ